MKLSKHDIFPHARGEWHNLEARFEDNPELDQPALREALVSTLVAKGAKREDVSVALVGKFGGAVTYGMSASVSIYG